MRALVDTHAFLWFCNDNSQLSARAKRCIEDSRNDILVSVASIWELAIKSSLGKVTLSRDLDDEFYEGVARQNIEFLDIEYQHAARVATLPFHHRDPFDRLLIAQCVVENLTLISQDSPLDAYDVRRLW